MGSAVFFFVLIVASLAMPQLQKYKYSQDGDLNEEVHPRGRRETLDDGYSFLDKENSNSRSKRELEQDVDVTGQGGADLVIYVKQDVNLGGCCYSGCGGGCSHDCASGAGEEVSSVEPEVTSVEPAVTSVEPETSTA